MQRVAAVAAVFAGGIVAAAAVAPSKPTRAAPAAVARASRAVNITLSNTALPSASGGPFLTGEASVLAWNGTYYLYMNDWGGCAGVDCCDSPGGCASCCFNPPTSRYPDACVYTNNHSVMAYASTDLMSWQYLGVALPLSSRRVGIEFRPQVVYCAATAQYVMWYEDRWAGQDGYAVAVSSTAAGPFVTVNDTVVMQGNGRVGDFALFVDDDGVAYHVRTGLVVERLTADYLRPDGTYYNVSNPSVEAPTLFKRDGQYYMLAGVGCCACLGGSDVQVYTASSPLGPYAYQGQVGRNLSQPFDASSPTNYVTHAQASAVFPVPSADGSTLYVWLGNAWVTSASGARNGDLLYWSLLEFDAAGAVQQLARRDNVTATIVVYE